MKSLNKVKAEFLDIKDSEIHIYMLPNTITIDTDKISIYDRTLDLTLDLSDIDLNKIKSIIINGITFNAEQ